MVADLNHLVRLNTSQIKPAAEMLARAFQDYPLNYYFIPDASERGNKLHYIYEKFIRSGVLYGEVYATSPNLEGVAAWLPSEKVDVMLWRVIRTGTFSLLFRFGKGFISRQLPVGKYISLKHKRHTPFRHWFLQVIGVDPKFQGEGYASTLMKAMLARIDEEHLPCYLDTEDERNVPFYQHFGFKVLEEDIIPATEIRTWAMLREKSS
jgi:ribosomal protein S18 acetylase RimI-like enzyme